MIGVDAADLDLSGMGLSAGLKGLVRKAFEKSNEKYAMLGMMYRAFAPKST